VTTQVSVASEAEGIERTVFGVDMDGGVELQWQSEDRLLIRYWGPARVLRREDRAGAVRTEYLPIAAL
jgi:hypothetical protein